MNIYLVERKTKRHDDCVHSAVVAADTRGEARGVVIKETHEQRSAWGPAITTITLIGDYTASDTEPHVILMSNGGV